MKNKDHIFWPTLFFWYHIYFFGAWKINHPHTFWWQNEKVWKIKTTTYLGPHFLVNYITTKMTTRFSRLKRIMTPHLIGLIHPQFQIKLCHVTWRHGRREGGSSNLFKVVSKVSKAISKLNYKNNFFALIFFFTSALIKEIY